MDAKNIIKVLNHEFNIADFNNFFAFILNFFNLILIFIKRDTAYFTDNIKLK